VTDGISIQIYAYNLSTLGSCCPPWLSVSGGTGKSGIPYKEGLIDIQAGTSDKRGTVSEPVCFRKRPRTVALKGLRARYVLSSSMLTELSPDPERQFGGAVMFSALSYSRMKF
jgi:hypothetical protein